MLHTRHKLILKCSCATFDHDAGATSFREAAAFVAAAAEHSAGAIDGGTGLAPNSSFNVVVLVPENSRCLFSVSMMFVTSCK